jgi:predicted DNA-binding transcriptional regulator YafY
MEPYLLKEYQNRWYLVARMKGFKNFITFGVDRITHLKIDEEKFTREDDMNVRQLFAEIIGLIYSTSDVEEVLMEIDEKQGKYFESLPWDESQKIFKKENKTFIQLILRPNFELMQRIMMYGNFVEVLKPEWLRNEVSKLLSIASKKYDK